MYCHAPTRAFIAKVLAVLAIITAGVVISVVLFRYLHNRELSTFRDQFQLLCLERSNTIQSQLYFSTTVMQGHQGLFGLVKNHTATEFIQPFGTKAAFQQYRQVSDTDSYLDFLLYTSIIRSPVQAVRWEQQHNVSLFFFNGMSTTETTRGTT